MAMRASTSLGSGALAGLSQDANSAASSAVSSATSTSSAVGGGDAALDTHALMTQTIASRQEIERWVNEQKSRLLAAKRDHEAASQEHARLATDAQRKRELLQHEHRESSAYAHDQESKVTAQQVEIEVLQAEKAKKEPALRELFAANQLKDEQLKHLVRESELQRASWAAQLAELQRGLDVYARLGLVFEQTNAEKIVIRFTQIDAAEPQREFSFLIRIDAQADTFVADACEPPVEALPELMEELNATADFSKLVRAMRREFKKLVE